MGTSAAASAIQELAFSEPREILDPDLQGLEARNNWEGLRHNNLMVARQVVDYVRSGEPLSEESARSANAVRVSDDSQWRERTPSSSVIRLPRLDPSPEYFLLLRQWEGCVESVDREEFRASLYDLTDPSFPEEEATFDIEEVAPGDRDLLTPGAVFYWSIGYETTRAGERKRISIIRFRRLPYWTKRRLQKVRQESTELQKRFGSVR